eukprot:gene8835-6218_t
MVRELQTSTFSMKSLVWVRLAPLLLLNLGGVGSVKQLPSFAVGGGTTNRKLVSELYRRIRRRCPCCTMNSLSRVCVLGVCVRKRRGKKRERESHQHHNQKLKLFLCLKT